MNRLATLVVLTAVLFSSAPAAALPDIGPAQSMMTPTYGMSSMGALDHAAASNGTHRLLVWGASDTGTGDAEVDANSGEPADKAVEGGCNCNSSGTPLVPAGPLLVIVLGLVGWRAARSRPLV